MLRKFCRKTCEIITHYDWQDCLVNRKTCTHISVYIAFTVLTGKHLINLYVAQLTEHILSIGCTTEVDNNIFSDEQYLIIRLKTCTRQNNKILHYYNTLLGIHGSRIKRSKRTYMYN